MIDSNAPIHFLLVEDDDIDVRVMERGFRQQGVNHPIVRAKDGQEALDLLRGVDGKSPPDWPYIVLLDINMPRMNGLEFLEEIRSDPDLCRTIVFVLTTSDDDKDIVAAYSNFVAGYLVKTESVDKNIDNIRLITQYADTARFIATPPIPMLNRSNPVTSWA
ncbi:MAG: response regulator [Lysobacterales bacterium]